MKKSEIAPLIDSLIPGLYSFGYGLIPDELQAEQLVVDAYSVFILREKEFILNYEHNGPKQRSRVRKYIQNQILADMLDLGSKRASQLQGLFRTAMQQNHFYSLEFNQRAALCMKENLTLSTSDMQEVFALKKHQVCELIHHARNRLVHRSHSNEVEGLNA
ncbi:MAG: hypothetical protein KC478_07555 [Bacteriovoracaceae bacterium]|nr:hypothetical protein [Bacteriovoracaceae bacterium]